MTTSALVGLLFRLNLPFQMKDQMDCSGKFIGMAVLRYCYGQTLDPIYGLIHCTTSFSHFLIFWNLYVCSKNWHKSKTHIALKHTKSVNSLAISHVDIPLPL